LASISHVPWQFSNYRYSEVANIFGLIFPADNYQSMNLFMLEICRIITTRNFVLRIL